MSMGYKLKKLRNLRGLTQREFGQMVGFSYVTADVRIAQYEAGTRVAKADMVHKMAEILEVNADYLMAPAPSSMSEIMQTLLFLDENNGVTLDKKELTTEDGNVVNRINLSIMGMDNLLEEWHEKQKALQNGELSQEEYYEWKMNWKIEE